MTCSQAHACVLIGCILGCLATSQSDGCGGGMAPLAPLWFLCLCVQLYYMWFVVNNFGCKYIFWPYCHGLALVIHFRYQPLTPSA